MIHPALKNITKYLLIFQVITFLGSMSLSSLSVCAQTKTTDLPGKKKYATVRGWNILSDHRENALRVIDVAEKEYDINHLQLSHDIVHDLKDIKKDEKRDLVNLLTREAHARGIPEVCIWDHALYKMDYYPGEFKIREGDKERIDLDNPAFWNWFKNDYRQMLDRVPDIDAIMLTFIETGAHVEDQHSKVLKTEGEKLAALVDTLANLFIDERKLKLYIRTFIYNQSELDAILECVRLLKHPEIIVMIKEVPHDFFLTHPVSAEVDKVKYPVIIEFDAAHEYNGQGIIASIFPDVHLKRWKHYMTLPNVIGYAARTDRYNDTKLVDGPCEINLYALKRATEDPEIDSEKIYDEFITKKYGKKALPYVKQAFKKSYDIITSTVYTLGIQIADHSRIHYDRQWAYLGHNPGEWHKNMEFEVRHDVNKKFHYWKDVTNHLAPARHKRFQGSLAEGVSFAFKNNWLEEKELMDTEYLGYIVAEKNYGVRLAQSAVEDIRKAEPFIRDTASYSKLYHTFKRTEITARAYRATAKVYFGYRLYGRGEAFKTKTLNALIWEGLDEIRSVSEEIRNYSHKGPRGQYDFESSANRAMAIYKMVTETGWEGGLYGGEVVKRME
jgi:hypothetical protein